MYSLVKSSPFPHLLSEQLPPLIVALAIAEIWFKFGSFTLECLGFLVTWFLLDLVIGRIRSRFFPRRQE